MAAYRSQITVSSSHSDDTGKADHSRKATVEIDCVCAGVLCTDVVCSPVDRVPEAGELVSAERMQLCLGGSAGNTALDLARLGLKVGVCGCVGRDVFGRYVHDVLDSGGVDIRGIHTDDAMQTACTQIVNVKGHDRRFIAAAGANTVFSAGHIPPHWSASARVFYIGGYLMLPALATGEMVQLLHGARQRGTTVVLDVVGVATRELFDQVARMLPETDVFLPNDDEAAALTGVSDPVAQAEAFRDCGAATVVITQGDRGSLLVGDGVRLRAGVYRSEFVGAGYIAGLLAGEAPAGCLRWGSALGASCVRAVGATESVFGRDEAERFMREHALRIEAF
jgi:sugar/nucleoside kinase (ribokinase family)